MPPPLARRAVRRATPSRCGPTCCTEFGTSYQPCGRALPVRFAGVPSAGACLRRRSHMRGPLPAHAMAPQRPTIPPGGPREATHPAAAVLASALLLSAAAALQAPLPLLAATSAAAREPSSAVVMADRQSSSSGSSSSGSSSSGLSSFGYSSSGLAAAMTSGVGGSGHGPVLVALGPQVPGASDGGQASGQQQQGQRQSLGWRFDASSEMEDGLLEAARQVTARIDSAFDVLSSGLEGDAEVGVRGGSPCGRLGGRQPCRRGENGRSAFKYGALQRCSTSTEGGRTPSLLTDCMHPPPRSRRRASSRRPRP